MIIACDFDGTLCKKKKFPQIGAPNDDLIYSLKLRRANNGDKVILWTCRSGEALKDAVAWCGGFGLYFDAVNEDLPEVKNSIFGTVKSTKVFAHIYIDDSNWELKFAEADSYPDAYEGVNAPKWTAENNFELLDEKTKGKWKGI